MRPSYRPELPPQPQSYCTQVLDHSGLVAGTCEELGMAKVIDYATQQDPAMRIVTASHVRERFSSKSSTWSALPPGLHRAVARYLLRPHRLAWHQLNGGYRQRRAAPAGAAEFGHYLLGEAGHLHLDLRTTETWHLEVAQE